MLEYQGIIDRRIYDSRPPRSDYVLTENGMKMRAVINAMRNWGREAS